MATSSRTGGQNGSATAAPKTVEEVRATVEGVRARLRGAGSADAIPNIASLAAELTSAGAELHAVLRAGAAEPGELADSIELAHAVAALETDIEARKLADRLMLLGRIRDSMASLSERHTPEELIEAVPGELCWCCGFTRAMVSRVRGSMWVPQVYDDIPGGDPEKEVFQGWVEGTEIPLDHTLIETELVRRRMPALVTNTLENPRTFKEIIVRGRTVAYVVAPIIPAGRAIGFLHADRLGQDHDVTEEDRDAIWTYAEQFGYVFHRAVLAERLGEQRRQLHDAFEEAERRFDELRDSEIELRGGRAAPPPVEQAALFLRPESRLEGLLTRREREVLELITSGATNLRIAEQLVLAEGTVKSHVKHILRKLRAGNRAEAVARYLQLVRRDQEEAER